MIYRNRNSQQSARFYWYDRTEFGWIPVKCRNRLNCGIRKILFPKDVNITFPSDIYLSLSLSPSIKIYIQVYFFARFLHKNGITELNINETFPHRISEKCLLITFIDDIKRERRPRDPPPPLPPPLVLFAGTLSLTPVIHYLSDRPRDESTLTWCT